MVRMNPIFLVVGPPAVGKSTTSQALAGRFSRSIHIPVDDIRNMVVSGLVLPSAQWSDALVQQMALARKSAVQMALEYHQAGFTVVIDDFWDADHFTDYAGLQTHPAFYKVVLLPGQDAAHQRNQRRSGDSPARAYIDQGIEIVYQQLKNASPSLEQDGWLVVDTTSMDVGQTVTRILELSTGS